MFDKLLSVATGGLAKEVFDAIKDYFPPSMSEAEKLQAQIAAMEVERNREREANAAAVDAERALNERIAAYEGTAADLKSLPILGPMMLFFRGMQRPVWGFATLWIDFQVFSGAWKLPEGQMESAFWVINFLVLGFLFGERAIKNVMPYLKGVMK